MHKVKSGKFFFLGLETGRNVWFTFFETKKQEEKV